MRVVLDIETAHHVHAFFEWFGIFVGAFLYRRFRKFKPGVGFQSPEVGSLIAGSLLGALLGSKLVALVEHPRSAAFLFENPAFLFSGQSIVGGLLGGWLGVELAKKLAKIGSRTGDDFVQPLLAGIAIGRVGCFLAGLNDGTYGVPTTMPWGVDFGDGIFRHPTQLYECLLAVAAMLTYPRWRRVFAHEAGLAFRVFIAGYLLWRLLIDGLKPVPFAYPLGWSGIQWICLLCLLGMLAVRLQAMRQTFKKRNLNT